jgi:hypothetical protein
MRRTCWPTRAMVELFPEARKFHLGLILAHQYLDQLDEESAQHCWATWARSWSFAWVPAMRKPWLGNLPLNLPRRTW